jgi:hypothetical protein
LATASPKDAHVVGARTDAIRDTVTVLMADLWLILM